MIDGYGKAQITDFGLSQIARASNSLVSNTGYQGQSLRWTAPEFLRTEPELSGTEQMASKESDIFSFGMVMIEVFTGEVPFNTLKSTEVVMQITGGKRPGRPNHPKFMDELWELAQRCWAAAPQDRSKIEEVLKQLHRITGSELPPVPPPKDRVEGLFPRGSIHIVAGGTTNGSSSGRPSGSGANNPLENGSDGGNPPSVPRRTKKHGAWRRIESIFMGR